jgi:hypothetical protein
MLSNLVDAFLELVDALPRIIGIAIDVRCAEMAPLEPIDGAQIAFTAVSQPAGVEERPGAVSVPDLDAALREEGGVCVSADEPEELFDDAAEVGAFGGEEGQGGVGEGEAEGGGCEEGVCAGAGAVVAGFAVCDGALDEGEVLVLFVGHGGGRKESDATRRADYVHACVAHVICVTSRFLPVPFCVFLHARHGRRTLHGTVPWWAKNGDAQINLATRRRTL